MELDEKEKFIEQSVARSRQALEEHLANTPDPTDLRLPPKALRYIAIPRRLMEVLFDPTNLIIKPEYSTADNLGFKVYLDSIELLWIMLHRTVTKQNPCLFSVNYQDNPMLRYKGVCTNFLQHQRYFAKQAGFRTVVGINNKDNVSFFVGNGNVTLDDVKPELKGHFPYSDEVFGPHYTIDFLNPEDKLTYLG